MQQVIAKHLNIFSTKKTHSKTPLSNKLLFIMNMEIKVYNKYLKFTQAEKAMQYFLC